mmetsp:Transcript_6312/g.4758  ORF Transcript_6312/g.4758 Transcript_6312/m.4758 type:complete len:109 (+) Transcript_6312:250-576(+)
MNRFMDFSEEDWNRFLAYKEDAFDYSKMVGADQELLATAPESFDWRDYGAITEVKDQAHCGASWAFAAAETIESANFLKTGELHVFSEQQLIDCARENYNTGCYTGKI